MPRNPASSPASRPNSAASNGSGHVSGLRVVSGGYDIDRIPILVTRPDGENVLAWICRLADRYGQTPGQVLDSLGGTRAAWSTTAAKSFLRRDRDRVAQQVGFDYLAPGILDTQAQHLLDVVEVGS